MPDSGSESCDMGYPCDPNREAGADEAPEALGAAPVVIHNWHEIYIKLGAGSASDAIGRMQLAALILEKRASWNSQFVVKFFQNL